MLLNDLVVQTKTVIPLFTDKFTTNVGISSVIKTGDNVQVVTDSSHGLSVGEQLIISGVKTQIPIINITTAIDINTVTRLANKVTVTTNGNHYLKDGNRVTISGANESGYNVTVQIVSTGLDTFVYFIASTPTSPATGTILGNVIDVAIATCSEDHDLSEGFQKNVEIESPSSDYAGTRKLLSVPNSTALVFTFEISGSPTDSTGILLTFHNLGFNGVQQVSSIISSTVFEYVLEDDRLTVGSGPNMLAMIAPRIFGSGSLLRAEQSYTSVSKGHLCAYFVFQGMVTSADPEGKNDSNNERTKQEDYKLRLINDVTMYVFIPTQDEISGADAVDLAQTLARPIYKALAAYTTENVFTTNQQTILMPASHGIINTEEVTPYLIYAYDFQGTEFLETSGSTGNPDDFMSDSGDTLPNFGTRAFRKFESKFSNEFGEIVKDDKFDV